jgi:hypothetical protein
VLLDVLTSDEVRLLLAELEPRERIMVLLDVATGLRQSELFALKWKDVDFTNKQLWVTRSIVQQVVRQLQDGGFTETRSPSRSLDPCAAELASKNVLPNTGQLGLRQSSESREKAVLGTTGSSAPHSFDLRKAAAPKVTALRPDDWRNQAFSPACAVCSPGPGVTEWNRDVTTIIS